MSDIRRPMADIMMIMTLMLVMMKYKYLVLKVIIIFVSDLLGLYYIICILLYCYYFITLNDEKEKYENSQIIATNSIYFGTTCLKPIN